MTKPRNVVKLKGKREKARWHNRSAVDGSKDKRLLIRGRTCFRFGFVRRRLAERHDLVICREVRKKKKIIISRLPIWHRGKSKSVYLDWNRSRSFYKYYRSVDHILKC